MARILIAEDDADTSDMLRALLSEMPHAFEFAADGEEALELYRAARREGRPYGLLLLDGAMPKRSGYKVAEEVRAGGDAGTKVVLFTNFYGTDIISGARAQAADAEHWPKLAVLDELPERIERALSGVLPTP